MAKRRMKSGKCCLCGEVKHLNYEHVPPRSAFNKSTRFTTMSLEEYLDERKRDFGIKSKVLQGGVGFHSYCEDCNGFLGSKYVRSYVEWVQAAVEALSYGRFDLYEYLVKDQNPNKIIKQVVSMLIAMQGDWFARSHPELVRFVADPETKELNEKYRLFCYLNTGSQMRYSNLSVVANIESRVPVQCVELAFPPLGYVMTIGSSWTTNRHFEITHFKTFDPRIKHNISIALHRLQTNLPFPLDYRTKEEIKRAKNTSA